MDIIRLGMERNLSVIYWANNILYANEINDTTVAYSEISGVPPVAFQDYEKTPRKGSPRSYGLTLRKKPPDTKKRWGLISANM